MTRTTNKKKSADTTVYKIVCSNAANDTKKEVLEGLCKQVEEAMTASDSDCIPLQMISRKPIHGC